MKRKAIIYRRVEIDVEKLVPKELDKPLAPKEVYFVRGIPMTHNAKVMMIAPPVASMKRRCPPTRCWIVTSTT